MENSNVVGNPIVPGTRLCKDEEGQKVDSTMVKQVSGSLMYLISTRPNIILDWMTRLSGYYLRAKKMAKQFDDLLEGVVEERFNNLKDDNEEQAYSVDAFFGSKGQNHSVFLLTEQP
ncbi:hypothetical protein KIW84_041939 [Lathyrus oleraceus]|uniref:Uncharacterized protein n=1 Tax=Pisum sativum TaxID=3888 RepID=A0A9D4XB99_PEA|nr:hypothetical protein KIW84_041939 [Pisum sativum]